MEKEAHRELMNKAIHDTYKKGEDDVEEKMNKDARKIAIDLDIEDRAFKTERREAVFTLKDHKPNFANRPEVRLINPTKSELGRVSKQKLAKVVQNIKEKTGLRQFKSDLDVVKWFKGLGNTSGLKFIEFDLVSFYPSITRNLLSRAIEWARTVEHIPEEDVNIIMNTKMSILVSKGEIWVKKGDDPFDVGMGSFDGAEVADLVGLFLLSQLAHLPIDGGLYRDDALFTCNLAPKQVHKVMEEIIAIMGTNDLKIKAKCNTTKADFFDVTFDLGTGKYIIVVIVVID